MPLSLKLDPVRNLKAYAVGKWLASRKHKKTKKIKGKTTSRTAKTKKQKSKSRARR